jgi:hypothetical protein
MKELSNIGPTLGGDLIEGVRIWSAFRTLRIRCAKRSAGMRVLVGGHGG